LLLCSPRPLAAPSAAQVAAIDDLWNPPSLEKMAPSPRKDDPNDFGSAFSIGPAGGTSGRRTPTAGTWFGGAQARLHFAQILAAEASITFHQNKYDDGDVSVTQYPVQLTAMLYVLPVGPLRPYILGGVGWYYTRFDYSGVFAAVNDRTEHIFGWHFGAGAELMLGTGSPSVRTSGTSGWIPTRTRSFIGISTTGRSLSA
jgi:opacity protein-like surface antigen